MDLTKMKPLRNRVIVKEKPEEQTGLIIRAYVGGKGGSGRADRGIVISAGPECESVKKGDYVLFSLMAPMLTIDDHLLMNETDIMAVINE